MPARKVITRAKERRAVTMLESGATLALAARAIGVSRQALHKHRQGHPDFDAELAEAIEVSIDVQEAELYAISLGRKTADKGQITALIYSLKNRRPDRWRERHEITGADGAPLVDPATLLAMARLVAGAAAQ